MYLRYYPMQHTEAFQYLLAFDGAVYRVRHDGSVAQTSVGYGAVKAMVRAAYLIEVLVSDPPPIEIEIEEEPKPKLAGAAFMYLLDYGAEAWSVEPPVG